ELLHRVGLGSAVGEPQLRPAGQAGTNAVAQAVVAHSLLELVHELGALGAWADDAHLAAQHVPELRQLVEAQFADDPSDPGDAVVVRRGPARPPVLLGVGAHAAELDQLEGAAVFADAFLHVQGRAAAA